VNEAPLDNPIWHALTGLQAHLALGEGGVRRFRPEFAPFSAMDELSDANLAALVPLLPEEALAVLFTIAPVAAPAGLEPVGASKLLQMVAGAPGIADGPDLVALGPADVPEMQELVAMTEPGPFAVRTVELGGYVGIRDQGRLIAMAGERLRPAGFTEVSAVCTHPDYRGRGLAKAVVSRVGRTIAGRGEIPFLHVRTHNEAAIATYSRLGFAPRREIDLTILRKPRAA
jgi:ribosomal protein S18 acetylase RimI-like enzyme